MSVKRVGPREALELLEQGYVYVDVRSVPEFDAGHPPGAYNVPLMHRGPAGMQPNHHFLEVMAASFAKDRKIVVGCRSGGRSLRAAQLLLQAGYTDVVDQAAGTAGAQNAFGQTTQKGWEAEGLPVSLEAEPGHDWASLSKG